MSRDDRLRAPIDTTSVDRDLFDGTEDPDWDADRRRVDEELRDPWAE